MVFKAKIKFLSKKKGGRSRPPLSGYKPQLKIGAEFTSVIITTLPETSEVMEFDVEHIVQLQLQFESHYPEETFFHNKIELYEGERLIGVGKFISTD